MTLLGQGEHCSLDPRRLARLGLGVGRQIRIASQSALGLYTISETRDESDDLIVRMALAARQRLGMDDEGDVDLDARVPHPTLSDTEARTQSEFVERLDDDGRQRTLAVLAPHGGDIEAGTDLQAERVGAALGPRRASVWQCRGFGAEDGAFRPWHITSTDIDPASFPRLQTLTRRPFSTAVAFHGFSEADVLIGGRAPAALKREIARAIQGALAGTDIPVRIAQRSEQYNGDDPANIVNRITFRGQGGVQIEQSIEARSRHGLAIADAVASVLLRRLARPSAAHGTKRQGR